MSLTAFERKYGMRTAVVTELSPPIAHRIKHFAHGLGKSARTTTRNVLPIDRYPIRLSCDKLFLTLATFQIYKNLTWLNGLSKAEAESVFLRCCGSIEWSRLMAAARPFALLDGLFAAAERLWVTLSAADQLEAYAAEKQTGARQIIDFQGKESRNEFDEACRLYETKFGFIFIVNASGRSGAEILAICRARSGNSAETELKIAAHEHRMVTIKRLSDLLEK